MTVVVSWPTNHRRPSGTTLGGCQWTVLDLWQYVEESHDQSSVHGDGRVSRMFGRDRSWQWQQEAQSYHIQGSTQEASQEGSKGKSSTSSARDWHAWRKWSTINCRIMCPWSATEAMGWRSYEPCQFHHRELETEPHAEDSAWYGFHADEEGHHPSWTGILFQGAVCLTPQCRQGQALPEVVFAAAGFEGVCHSTTCNRYLMVNYLCSISSWVGSLAQLCMIIFHKYIIMIVHPLGWSLISIYSS